MKAKKLVTRVATVCKRDGSSKVRKLEKSLQVGEGISKESIRGCDSGPV